MDLDKVRINSDKMFGNGNFNAQESLYWSNIYVGDAIREVTEELKNINKNLEKITNKPKYEMYTPFCTNNKGEFYGPIEKELNLDTIICNKNKDSYVDKNIIL